MSTTWIWIFHDDVGIADLHNENANGDGNEDKEDGDED
jgi:hypothetical protein